MSKLFTHHEHYEDAIDIEFGFESDKIIHYRSLKTGIIIREDMLLEIYFMLNA